MIDLARYNALATIQKESLLTFDEQEEMIAISTKLLYYTLQSTEVKNILTRLKDRQIPDKHTI
jgi:hypothetical protein